MQEIGYLLVRIVWKNGKREKESERIRVNVDLPALKEIKSSARGGKGSERAVR